MSKQNKSAIILLKSRSYRANVKEAFHLFASNMKSFFLSLFPFPFFAGLVVAMLSVITRNVSNWLFWLSLCVAWIILVYLIAVFRQAFVYMLTDFGELQTIKKISWRKPEWKIFRQALPTFYLLMIQSAIFFLLVWRGILLWSISPFCLIPVALIVVFLLVPFNLSIDSLQLDGIKFLQSVKNGFMYLRYFASTLTVIFLAFLFILLVSAVSVLPVFILNQAISASDMAVFYGDPTDLPDSIYIIHFFLCVVLFTVITFSLTFWFLTQYFHYFSLLKKEEERNKEIAKQKLTRQTYRTYISSIREEQV